MQDLKPLLLLADGRELLKVSTIYPNYFTAIVELGRDGNPPERTTVRDYSPHDLSLMKPPGKALLERYDKAYGR